MLPQEKLLSTARKIPRCAEITATTIELGACLIRSLLLANDILEHSDRFWSSLTDRSGCEYLLAVLSNYRSHNSGAQELTQRQTTLRVAFKNCEATKDFDAAILVEEMTNEVRHFAVGKDPNPNRCSPRLRLLRKARADMRPELN